MYDYIIVTSIPAFYKVNLYNELNKNFNILVIFIASNTSEKRSEDFISISNCKFKYKIIFKHSFQSRNKFKTSIELLQIIRKYNFKKLLVGGWDMIEYWVLVFFSSSKKNCLALESTINESINYGIKGFVKRMFLNRISKVFASGKMHKDLLKSLNYCGIIKICKGVGIINKHSFNYENKSYERKFLFIGRLSYEKNINILISIFNSLPNYKLSIIGTGPLEEELKKKIKKNIKMIGDMKNKELNKYFLSHDFLILPSFSEPWGLVVDEALFFRTPVIVSNKCGSSELVQDNINGYIFDPNNENNLKRLILNIDNNKYNFLRKNLKVVKSINFGEIYKL